MILTITAFCFQKMGEKEEKLDFRKRYSRVFHLKAKLAHSTKRITLQDFLSVRVYGNWDGKVGQDNFY